MTSLRNGESACDKTCAVDNASFKPLSLRNPTSLSKPSQVALYSAK